MLTAHLFVSGCIGWPVLIATVGTQGAALSMLLGEDGATWSEAFSS
jgi:hypothetical protein